MKTALITGANGQDGAYLSKLLSEKGYNVYGLVKHRSSRENLKKIGSEISIIEGDITDRQSVNLAIKICMPDEIYNLAAQSHVGYSFKCQEHTCAVNYSGFLNVLLSAREYVPKARIYQAGTSEMFGYAAYSGESQNEDTPFKPMSPYAVSKVAAHWAGVNARYEADQFVSNGILFNHESPIRESRFVTRKITDFVRSYAKGNSSILKLGNIDSIRDWGFAGDYVKAMHAMLQHDCPSDFVISSGTCHTVREFVSEAFAVIGMDIRFEGVGINEKGYIGNNLVMEVDNEFYRPNDLSYLCGDSAKARNVLGWQPEIGFKRLVEMMVKE